MRGRPRQPREPIPVISVRYRGVTYYKPTGKWKATLTMPYKQIHIGYYKTAEEAAKAYDEVAREAFGDKAKCNFTANGNLNQIINTAEGITHSPRKEVVSNGR